ncbi:MAG TPA: leucine-rich repeat domain-containing protein, partial [Hanamia sp.]|nr:leucine-rich repeat domain-containing protein [Hanamia sp.]
MKHFLLYLLISFLALLKINIANAQVNTQDSLALVDLYNSTNGANWANHPNWLTTAPVSTWYGITLDGNNRVKFLSLVSNQLTGSLPSSIGNLTNLQELELGSNQLSGSIPSSLGNLPNLQYLDLANNLFTFAGLEPFVPVAKANASITLFDYSPQSTILPITYKNGTLSVSAGGTLSNNT